MTCNSEAIVSAVHIVCRNVTVVSLQFLALATALYASYAQESATVPLHGNYRKPQLADNRVVLVSFKDGKLSLVCCLIVYNMARKPNEVLNLKCLNICCNA